MTTLEQELAGFIASIVPPDRCPEVLAPDLPLLDGNVLDSLALLQLIEHLEHHYGLILDNSQLDVAHLGSVTVIAGCVREVAG